jgi:hypothetical protein
LSCHYADLSIYLSSGVALVSLAWKRNELKV